VPVAAERSGVEPGVERNRALRFVESANGPRHQVERVLEQAIVPRLRLVCLRGDQDLVGDAARGVDERVDDVVRAAERQRASFDLPRD
jgi:hypothetical protein